MTNSIKQTLVDVIYETDDEQLVALTIRLAQRDRVQAELTAQRKGWPSPAQAPILALTIAAWSALQRDPGNNVPSVLRTSDIEQFIDRVVEIQLNTDQDSAGQVDPTQAGQPSAPASL